MGKIIWLIISVLIISSVTASSIEEHFKEVNGDEWSVEVADWGYITNAAKPRPIEVNQPIDQNQAIQNAVNFLNQNLNFFGMEHVNYTESAKITERNGLKSWVVVFEGQKLEGLPITDTHTTVILTEDGQVFAVANLRYYFEEEVLTEQLISKEEAIEKAQEFLQTEQKPNNVEKTIKDVIKENNELEPRLVWNVVFGCPNPKSINIDAKTGDILNVENLNKNCNAINNIVIYLVIALSTIISFVFIVISRKRKKGVVFGFIIVFIALTLLSLIVLQQNIVYKQKERMYIQNRINDINSMYESIMRDVNKAVEITTKRAMGAAISSIITTGNPLDMADYRLKELVLEGKLYGKDEPLMENATLPDWVKKVEEVGSLKGYYVNLSFKNFEIKPYDSFNLVALSEISANITDKNGAASIVRKWNLQKTVSITGLEDPIYSLNTNGKATNIFRKSKHQSNYTILLVTGNGTGSWRYGLSVVLPTSKLDEINSLPDKTTKILVTDDASVIPSEILNQFLGVVSENDVAAGTTVSYVKEAAEAMKRLPNNTNILLDSPNGKVWFIENFKEHAEQSYYAPSSNGGSFLDRLEGKLNVQTKYSSQTANVIGLESFVNKEYFSSVGISPKSGTNIDYLYFSSSTYPGDKVKAMSNSFEIDDESSLGSTHQMIYGVSEILT